MATVQERVAAAIGAARRLVVAVSGGPDSVCVLHVLATAEAEHRPLLWAACLDHGLRPEARSEVRAVHALTRRLQVGWVTDRVDTRAFARSQRLSLEDAARRLRYAFLARVCRDQGAEAVVTGHTLDDQAETVLLHLLRGSGLDGLAGMAAETDLPVEGTRLRVLRPLLTVTRTEVEAYCAAHRLPVAHDASNRDPAHTRNRIRHHLLPMLARFNPQIRPALARLAEVAQGDLSLLRLLTDAALSQVDFDGERALIGWPVWTTWSDPLRRRVIRACMARLNGQPVTVDLDPLKAALAALARAQTGSRFDLGAGWLLARERAGVAIRRADAGPPARPTLTVTAGRWALKTIRANPDRFVAYVDAAAVRAALHAAGLRGPARTGLAIRSWRAGDRIQPLGLSGRSVKLSDLFGNAGVSAAARRAWPIVVVGDQIVWVPGLRLDQRFAARNGNGMLKVTVAPG